uniref:Protein Ycf2 n=1 Tax=Angiopteris evecta TaxID=13825 RepID=YCF2_ANGEV|nr:hypothetical chloroplast RF2 [Angiopteris evecta]A2T308.1 RecName: Full=Protein Ycf2 [Angiopteris evecta]ABG79575.1 hypothetical chloroplast RF2 [Angiopteris evecta]
MEQKLVKNTSSLSKIPDHLKEINNIQNILILLTRLNLVRFLFGIFSNLEYIVKLFDFRILNSLILRDLRSSNNQRNKLLLKLLLLLVIPISLYRLNTKSLIERRYLDLAKIVNGYGNSNKVRERLKEHFESSYSSISPNIFNSSNREAITSATGLQEYYSDSPTKAQSYGIIPVSNTIDFSDPDWWKSWIIKDILPSWNISQSKVNEVQMLLSEKSIENLKNFFEFYIDIILCKPYDWKYDFDLYFVMNRNQNRNQDEEIDWKQVNRLDDTLFPSAIVAFCDKILFEVEGPLNRQGHQLDINLNFSRKYLFHTYISLSRREIKNWIDLIQPKGWIFFQDFAEFYIWQSYSNKNSPWKGDRHLLDRTRHILEERFVDPNDLEEDQSITKVQYFLSDIIYNFSEYILSRIEKFNQLETLKKRIRDDSSLITQPLKDIFDNQKIIETNKRHHIENNFLDKEKGSTSSEKNSITTNFFLRFGFYNISLFRKWNWKQFLISNYLPTNIEYIKELNGESHFSDISFLIKNEKEYLENKIFSESKNSAIVDLFPTERRLFDNTIPKEIKYGLLDILSIHELNGSFIDNKQIFEKNRSLKTQEYLFDDSGSSEVNRIVDLWKIKNFEYSFFESSLSPKDCLSKSERYLNNKYSFLFFNKSLFLDSSSLIYSVVNFYINKDYVSSDYSRFKKTFVTKIDQLILRITNPGLLLTEGFSGNSNRYKNFLISKSDSSINQILYKYLKVKNIEYFSQKVLKDLIREYFKIGGINLGKTKEQMVSLWTLSQQKIRPFWDELKEKTNISLISLLTTIYKQNQLISLSSIYTVYSYQYIRILHSDYFLRVKNNFEFWINNDTSNDLTKNIISPDLVNWKINLEKWFNQCIVQIDQYRGVYLYLNVYKWRDGNRQWKSFFSYIVSNKYPIISVESKNLLKSLLLLRNEKISRNHFSKSLFLTKTFINRFLDYSFPYMIEPFLYKLQDIDQFFFYRFPKLLKIPSYIASIKEFFGDENIFSKESKCFLDDKNFVSLTRLQILRDKNLSNFLCNEDICMEGLNDESIFAESNYWLNDVAVTKKISPKSCSDESNTLKLLDYLYNPRLNYNERLRPFEGKFITKGYDSTYKDILNNVPIRYNHQLFLSTPIRPFYGEKDTISFVQSQVFKKLLARSQRFNRQTLGYIDNLYKLLIALTRSNSFSHGNKNSYSFGKDLKNRLQIVNFDIGKSFFEADRSNQYQSFRTSSKLQDESTEYQPYPADELFPEFLSNLENHKMLHWLRRFLLYRYLTPKSFQEMIDNKFLKEKKKELETILLKEEYIIRSFYPININEVLDRISIYKTLQQENISNKWSLFRNYTPWFFTLEWWNYLNNLVSETFPEVLLNTNDLLDSNRSYIIRYINNLLTSLWLELKFRSKNENVDYLISKSDSFLVKEISNQKNKPFFKWSLLRFVNGHNVEFSAIVLLLIFIYGISRHYLPTLLGFNSISLWKRIEIIRYLMDPLQGFYLKKLMHSPSTKFMQTRDLLIYRVKRILKSINHMPFYFFIKGELDIWLYHRNGLDTFRPHKRKLTQHLTTNKIISHYGLNLNYGSNFLIKEPGLNYLRFLVETCQKDLIKYQICNFESAEKWVLSALQQKILFPQKIWQDNSLNIPSYQTPASLQLGSFPSKGILLIGPMETGRSYLIKNLAADSYLPSIRIPVNKLLYNKLDFKNTPATILSKQSLLRLNLLFESAEKMSPCIIWIQDIHELNINRFGHRSEADPKLLLCSVLKNISNSSFNSYTKNNIVIASTHMPTKVDPAIISPNRLDQLINLRILTNCQRQKEFPVLLGVKGFDSKADSAFLKKLGYKTMGYSKRDLSVLANEALLIGITLNTSFVCSDTIRLSLHKQISAVTYTDNESRFSLKYEILFYKIGKAIIRNTLINTSSIDFSFVQNNLLKRRFYFLSNWYLEPAITESTIKEFTILPHILGFLAGFAARDSWFILENKKENFIFIDKVVENDLNLSVAILEGLLTEFSYLEICEKKLDEVFVPPPQSKARNFLNMMQQGLSLNTNKQIVRKIDRYKSLSSVRSERNIPRSIAWSPRVWRISFLRSNIYESIRIPSESNRLYNLIVFYQNQDKLPKRNFDLNKIKSGQSVSHKRKEKFFGYKRSLGNMRQKQIQTLESQLENVLLREHFFKLGISNSSTQYQTQYDSSYQSILFLGGRFIWNSAGLIHPQNNLVFSRLDLFANEETVRRLYITYGVRRDREKHYSNEKIKQFFLHRGYDRNLMTKLVINWWKRLPFAEKKHFEFFNNNQMMRTFLQHPQLFSSVYLHQDCLLEDLQEKYARFNLSIHRQRWIRSNRLLFNDLSIYNMLFESYQYLLNLFLSNRSLLIQLTNILVGKKLILPNEIHDILYYFK